MHIPVSGFLLHPVVGVVGERPDFQVAEWEVARLLEVRLEEFTHPDVVRREMRQLRRDGEVQEVEVPYFDLHGEKVWGATAMVLAEFLAIASRAGLLRQS